ncbi:hypothetical protein ALC60_09159 [Trachymyrmex zeteki]|uniref:Uncharacterized protein n=1 Tax=Mycetomoellerius zeteki TaxID=64791 RepID=A0A151WVN1_9HYME|nr:hypothetical protein ALC60_09159 [Trachymyrmex zeteki]
MDKLRFDFKMRGSSDGKTTILSLTSIGTPDGRTFAIPDEFQNTNLHKELITSQVFGRVKNSLKKRNQFRKIWITLIANLSKVYLDEDDNLLFEGYYLEEITEQETEKRPQITSDDTIKKLLEEVLENKQQKSEVQNLNKIAKDFMIEKCNGKNSNANQWINEFQKECERCKIEEDRKKIEILKFFLEKSSADWYSCMILKFTVESDWTEWKRNFCETFGSKGWSPIRYAFAFKYQIGSLLDYALKKEKLLLQVRKSIDKETLIDLIAIGLPNYVSDKIDRENLQETQDLYNEISKLEHLVEKKGKVYFDNKQKKQRKKNHAKYVRMQIKVNVFILNQIVDLEIKIKKIKMQNY